jgi:inner membrane protein
MGGWPVADGIGWLATSLFVGSYWCKDQQALRRIQALAACLWVVYGTLMQAPPVIAANVLVAVVAAYSSLGKGRRPAAAQETRSGA